jgi:hypothetical protein
MTRLEVTQGLFRNRRADPPRVPSGCGRLGRPLHGSAVAGCPQRVGRCGAGPADLEGCSK